jgi:hypothetical protein
LLGQKEARQLLFAAPVEQAQFDLVDFGGKQSEIDAQAIEAADKRLGLSAIGAIRKLA